MKNLKFRKYKLKLNQRVGQFNRVTCRDIRTDFTLETGNYLEEVILGGIISHVNRDEYIEYLEEKLLDALNC